MTATQYSQPSAGVVAMNMNWYAPIPPAWDVSRACRTYAVDSYERRCAPTYTKLKTEPCSEKIKKRKKALLPEEAASLSVTCLVQAHFSRLLFRRPPSSGLRVPEFPASLREHSMSCARASCPRLALYASEDMKRASESLFKLFLCVAGQPEKGEQVWRDACRLLAH